MSNVPSPPEDDNSQATTFPADVVNAQLERILRSADFVNAGRVCQFINFVVEKAMAKDVEHLNEYGVAFGVFGQPADFDPDKNSIVRTNLKRLRMKLDAYYAGSGKHDPVLIDLSKGYVPRFSWRTVDVVEEPKPAEVLAVQEQKSGWTRWWWLTLILLLVLMFVAWLVWFRDPSATSSGQEIGRSNARPRRVFSQATSEGGKAITFATGERYWQLLVTPDGETLYAISPRDEKSISVFGAKDLKLKRRVVLPHRSGYAVLSSNSRHIYLSSPDGVVMVFETGSDKITEVISVPGEVFDVAVTNDEKKLFLAMGNAGLRRMLLPSREVRELSPLACPVHLGIDPSGKQLFVNYECGGPGGRAGHDAVDVYDIESERSLYVIKDLPMVGGHPAFSPRGEVVLLDARDACRSKNYDHVGCPPGTPNMFHVWSMQDRRLLGSYAIAGLSDGTFLPFGTRVLFLGETGSVWDWARQMIVEQIKFPGDVTAVAAIAPSGDRLFIQMTEPPGIVVYDAEKETCMPPLQGLTNFYSGDGTANDLHGGGVLRIGGKIGYSPGRTGEAFHLNGIDNFLYALNGAPYCPFCTLSWTEVMSVKFESLQGEMTILEMVPDHETPGRKLFKSAANQFVLESGGREFPKLTTTSSTPVKAGQWYHVAVVTDRNDRLLYVDGVLQAANADQPKFISHGGIVQQYVGSSGGNRNFFHGLVDELAVYNRPLSAAEVKSMATGCFASK